MPQQSRKLLALAALLALASKNVSAFTPSTLSTQRNGFAISPLSAASDDVSIDYDSAAKLAYDGWRNNFSKGDFNEDKYESFKGNYEALTIANVKAAKMARDQGGEAEQKLELNEYADMTVAEYQAMQAGPPDPIAPDAEDETDADTDNADANSDVSIPYDSAARLAYDNWRVKFDKGEFVATRFVVFKENYEIVTVANIAAKKSARESGSAASSIELAADADTAAVEIDADAPASPLKAALDALQAQDAAADAIGDAAIALAEEEQVRISANKQRSI
jgi:hypothetical protein